ncbi:NS3 [Tibet orbivirus]|nr:NS3 [Tibet orbivirus]QXO97791.1 NS3 [Tibet orbivirus]BCI65133.1 Non-structural protein [Tibet orbivirus]
MLSGLVRRFEEERIDMPQEVKSDELSLVNYYPSESRPPSYAPMAPTMTDGMASVSLGILNQAMTNTTGATTASKLEKAAYGSYAEAFRDDLRLRQVKKHVNDQIIPKLSIELSHLRRKKIIVGTIMLVAAIIALVTSAGTLTNDLSISMKTGDVNITIPAWFKGFSAVFGFANLGSTMIMMLCARTERMLTGQIDMIQKELMKKKSYNEAVRMSMAELSGMSLEGIIPNTGQLT